MNKLHKATATLGSAALLAAPVMVFGASSAQAAEFDYAGAEVEYDVSRDDGRYDVEVEVDDARPGSRWRVTLWHNGQRYFNQVRVATGGDFEVERERPNRRGEDRFRMRIKRIGGPAAVNRVIVRR